MSPMTILYQPDEWEELHWYEDIWDSPLELEIQQAKEHAMVAHRSFQQAKALVTEKKNARRYYHIEGRVQLHDEGTRSQRDPIPRGNGKGRGAGGAKGGGKG